MLASNVNLKDFSEMVEFLAWYDTLMDLGDVDNAGDLGPIVAAVAAAAGVPEWWVAEYPEFDGSETPESLKASYWDYESE